MNQDGDKPDILVAFREARLLLIEVAGTDDVNELRELNVKLPLLALNAQGLEREYIQARMQAVAFLLGERYVD
jgi:hypothetical protein